jgi:hypothetical protein
LNALIKQLKGIIIKRELRDQFLRGGTKFTCYEKILKQKDQAANSISPS